MSSNFSGNGTTGDELRSVLGSLIGQAIVSAEAIPDIGEQHWYRNVDPYEHPVAIALTLADGQRVTFCGWGYDEWGIDVEVGA